MFLSVFCKIFDVDVDGYVCGEVVLVIYVKKFSDVIWDGDLIWFVVWLIVVNVGGKFLMFMVLNMVVYEVFIWCGY